MKKYILVISSILCLAGLVKAEPQVVESPYQKYGTPTTVSISTSAWTLVPTASSLSGRRALIVSNPASNTTADVAHIGACSATAIATTVRPLELAKGGYYVIPIGDADCLWVLSIHTAAQNLHVQEVK